MGPIGNVNASRPPINLKSNTREDYKTGDRKPGSMDITRKDSQSHTEVPNTRDENVSKGTQGNSKSSLVPSTGGSKRSKNSYSIAALCQISVNIGGDPSAGAVIVGPPCEGMTVSSPGLISLTSVGTGSPIGTPAPTPTPPI